MSNRLCLINFMEWLQEKGINFEMQTTFKKTMSGVYLREDMFDDLVSEFLENKGLMKNE